MSKVKHESENNSTAKEVKENYEFLKKYTSASNLIIAEAKKRNVKSLKGRDFNKCSINNIANGVYRNRDIESIINQLAEKYKQVFD